MDQKHNHNFLHTMVRRDYTTIDGTVYSVDNVTPTPTFTGVIGSYSTAPVSVPQTQSSDSGPPSGPTDGPSSSTSSSSSSSPSPTSVTPSNAPAPSYTAGAITPESLPSSSSGSTMSTGGRIGLAVVIILIIGGLAGTAMFYMSRKKNKVIQEQEREDAEKDAVAAEARRRTFLASQKEEAPKLSLRPASSFLPDLMSGVKRKSRLSAGNMLASTTERNPWKEQYLAAIGKGQDIPMSEKSPTTENPFTDPKDPFADPVKRSVSASGSDSSSSSKSSTTATSASVSDGTTANDDAETSHGPVQISDEEIHAVVTRPKRQHEPVEMPSSPVIPAPLQPPKVVSTTPASNNDGNVYRILMDFTPSMDDELELKAGQVVRMLHEYDDGWCLASRLDRSQQGVVPRTCLAPKPSKARPQPGNRPSSPAMRNSPPVSRSMSPANGPRIASSQSARSSLVNSQPLSPGAYNQTPRPLSPGPRPQQKSSMSPGPIASPQLAAKEGRRSNSASARAREVQDRRASPPGPSKLGPGVPGMAM